MISTIAFISPVHPAYLWGGALVAAPILIHLFFRQRYRVVQWAATDLLRQALTRTRRRIQLEQLIILLLRCLAILLLALLIAKPILNVGATGPSILRGRRSHHIILLDDSFSMEGGAGSDKPWRQVQKVLPEFVRSLAREHSGDRLTLLLTSAPQRPYLNGLLLSEKSATTAAQRLAALKSSPANANIQAALEELLRQTEAVTEEMNVVAYVVSDYRKKDWNNERQAKAEGPVGDLQKVSKVATELILLDVGEPVEGNLAVTAVELAGKSLLAGVPNRLAVEVRNTGTEPAEDVDVMLQIAGAPAVRRTIPKIPPNSKESVLFQVAFEAEGTAPVTVSLGADDLDVDNTRYFAGIVDDGHEILIVNGEPARKAILDESFYLEKALAPQGPFKSGFKPVVIAPDEFERVELADYSAVMLCNVANFGGGLAERLQRYVEDGGGLAIFHGDKSLPSYWNVVFAEEAPELAIAELGKVKGDLLETSWATLKIKDESHPIFASFEKPHSILVGVKQFRWWTMTRVEEKPSRPIVTIDDTELGLIGANVGDGRLLVSAVPVDDEWSNWPADPGYLVLTNEIANYISRSGRNSLAAAIGEEFSMQLPSAEFKPEMLVKKPERDDQELLRATAAADSKFVVFQHKDTNQPGFYEMELNRIDGGEEVRHFAVNVDPAESELERLDTQELLQRIGSTRAQLISEPEHLSQGIANVGNRNDLTTLVIVLLLAVLMAEQFLARRFGEKRALTTAEARG